MSDDKPETPRDQIQDWRDSAMHWAGGAEDHDEIIGAAAVKEALDKVLQLVPEPGPLAVLEAERDAALAEAAEAKRHGREDHDARASWNRRWNALLAVLPGLEPGDVDAVGHVEQLVARAQKAERDVDTMVRDRREQDRVLLAIVEERDKAKAMVDLYAERDRLEARVSNLRARGCDGAADEVEEKLGDVARRIGGGSPAPAPQPTNEPSFTIFQCRCCDASTSGKNDGSFDAPNWGRIEGIDGPNALCPRCVADPLALEGLVADGYPDARIAAPKPDGEQPR